MHLYRMNTPLRPGPAQEHPCPTVSLRLAQRFELGQVQSHCAHVLFRRSLASLRFICMVCVITADFFLYSISLYEHATIIHSSATDM